MPQPELPRRTPHSVRASRLARASRVGSQLEPDPPQPTGHVPQQEEEPEPPEQEEQRTLLSPRLELNDPLDRLEAEPNPRSQPHPQPQPTRQDQDRSCILPLALGALQHLDQQAGQSLALNRAYQNKLVRRMTRLAERDEQLNRFKLLLDQIDHGQQATKDEEAAAQSDDDDDDDAEGGEEDEHKDEHPHPHPHPRVLPSSAAATQVSLVAQGFKELALPWFKHFHGQSLPPNRDAKIREAYLALTKFQTWSASDRLRLKQEVATQLSRRQHLQGQDQNDPMESLDPTWMADSIDWDAIALVFPRHSSIDCRLQYLQHDHPRINVQPWTQSELERLYTLHETLPPTSDLSILSTLLKTHRTPSDCLRQLRRRPYASTPRPFDAQEDAKLLQGMTLYGQDWQALSAYVGRPANALITRWTKTLEPTIKKGKFTPLEDQLLSRAVQRWGTKKWKEVSSGVPGRTDAQCRERWCNHLDPQVVEARRKKWTQEEDALLNKLRGEGLGWSTLAKRFKGRTDNACLVRWRTLEGQGKRAEMKADNEGEAAAGDETGSNTGTKKRTQEGEVEHQGKKKKKKRKQVEVEDSGSGSEESEEG